MKIAERIKELRADKKLNQSELAKNIGYSQSVVAYWESGQKMPSAEALISLANFFGVTTDYILCRVDFQ